MKKRKEAMKLLNTSQRTGRDLPYSTKDTYLAKLARAQTPGVWTPNSWAAGPEPTPYGIYAASTHPAQTFHIPSDGLYRFKRLDRPERHVTWFSDDGDTMAPEGHFQREFHAWHNRAAQDIRAHGYVDTWTRWDATRGLDTLLARPHPFADVSGPRVWSSPATSHTSQMYH